ncbi:hypothetical protein WA026_002211 [Henosepilachna vigintioctopunctata]|uniref:Uncharacterized protein n=1 Tax=Henosepilachna vigintioctopunctata TaxID=420089 RepID=A0AAW1U3A3_9CUCU
MDTCSTCDEFQAEKKHLDIKISSLPDGHEKSQLLSQLRKLEIENLAHKKRAEVFYDKKRKARLSARQDATTIAIAMNFSKNLPIANITTNDVYYKRQLSYFINFNNSPWESSVINTPASLRSMKAGIVEGEFESPGLAYKDKLPISTAKYNDLQFLKKFCRPETKRYYDHLPHAANIKDATAN